MEAVAQVLPSVKPVKLEGDFGLLFAQARSSGKTETKHVFLCIQSKI